MDLAWLERVRSNDKCCTQLRLRNQGITSAMATELANAMKTNTMVHSIDLTDNQIGNEGCSSIAAAVIPNINNNHNNNNHNNNNNNNNHNNHNHHNGNHQNGNHNHPKMLLTTSTSTTQALIQQLTPSLRSLEVGKNQITGPGVAALAKALIQQSIANNNSNNNNNNNNNNTSNSSSSSSSSNASSSAAAPAPVIIGLQELDLSHNEGIGAAGIVSLADALPQITSLIKLDLSATNLGDDGVTVLVQGLRNNRSVTWLGLRNNRIGPNGIMALSKDLLLMQQVHMSHHFTTMITSLHLRENHIGVQGMKYLTNALKTNRTITELDVSSNHIGPAGAQAMADVLVLPKTVLQILFVCDNQIGDDGMEALAMALKENTSVTYLDVSTNNQITFVGAEALDETFRVNRTLTHVMLHGNDHPTVQAPLEPLERNRVLRHHSKSLLEHGPGLFVRVVEVQSPPQPHAQQDVEGAGGRGEDHSNVGVTTTSPHVNGSNGNINPHVRPARSSSSHHSRLRKQKQKPKLRLEWTEELWKGTRLDEPIEWVLIHRVLQVLRHASGQYPNHNHNIIINNNKSNSSRCSLPHHASTTAAAASSSSSISTTSNLPPWPFPTGPLLECLQRQPKALVDLIDKSTNEQGSNLLHVAIAAESPLALDLCKFLVSDLGANIDRVKDAHGRSARDIGMLHTSGGGGSGGNSNNSASRGSGSGSDKISEWARCVGYFLHRYQVEGGSLHATAPVYRTEKGMAHFARDAYKPRTDPMAEVMLFILTDDDGEDDDEEEEAGEVEDDNDDDDAAHKLEENKMVDHRRHSHRHIYQQQQHQQDLPHHPHPHQMIAQDRHYFYQRDTSSSSSSSSRYFSNEVSCRLLKKMVDANRCDLIPSGADIPEKAQRFSDNYVVPLIRFHDELDESGIRRKCLVFPLLERSLQGMIDLERIACSSVDLLGDVVMGIAKAIQHVHHRRQVKNDDDDSNHDDIGNDDTKALIHCNIEPRNIIRTNGTYKLMGFDMAVPEGEPVIMTNQHHHGRHGRRRRQRWRSHGRTITNSCPPELARFLIRLESLEDLTTNLSELQQQQLQVMDMAGPAVADAAAGESNRLLEILKEIQLLRKKLTILELLESHNNSIAAFLYDRLDRGRKHRSSIHPNDSLQLSSTTLEGLGSLHNKSNTDSHSHAPPPPPPPITTSSSPARSTIMSPNGMSWIKKQPPGEESGQVRSGSLMDSHGQLSMGGGGDDDGGGAVAAAADSPGSPLTDKSEDLETVTGAPMKDIVITTTAPKEKGVLLPLTAHPTFDVWSFGTTLYKMLTGEDLFPTNHDGHLTNVKDQIDLALWEGLTGEQLNKILSRCQGASVMDKNRAKDLVSRCLHPDPSQRLQSMDAVLAHCFLSGKEKGYQGGELIVEPLAFSFGIEEAPQVTVPCSFLLLPCKIFNSEHATGAKLVAPAQAKDAMDKFSKMQELAILQHLLTAKYKDNDMETEQIIRDCRNLDGKEAAEKLLKYMQISDASIEYFIERIQDLNEFKKTPSTFLENKSNEAFHDWWQAYAGRPVYFYLIDEYFAKPLVTDTYPIELTPRSSSLKDLIPLLCLRKTQVPVLSACAFVMGRSVSLPSRLNDWAVTELNKVNGVFTMSEYQAYKQAVSKLSDFESMNGRKNVEATERFANVDDAMTAVMENFLTEHDPQNEFSGLRRVSDRDGSCRWTSELGSTELEKARSISVAENISRRRQLEEALHEAQETVQRVGATAKRLVEERDALQKEKLALIRSNKCLEDYIDKEMLADATPACCSIL